MEQTKVAVNVALPMTIVDRIRSRGFFIIVVLIGLPTIILWMYESNVRMPELQAIVIKTHKQFNEIIKTNIPKNVKLTSDFTVDEKYLLKLGFINNTAVTSYRKDVLPVIATTVSSGGYENAIQLHQSAVRHLASPQIIFINIGLSTDDELQLINYCNSSSDSCEVRKFQFDDYPSHFRDDDMMAYRPICIQEILRDHQSVIWTNGPECFLKGNISQSLTIAQEFGLAVWEIMAPTSSLTHPKMFTYFKQSRDKYIFHHAAKCDHMIIYNTKKIHEQLMLPWVTCALTFDCISPLGAGHGACNQLRKPQYKYSGCHNYDMSAFNVILGIMFDHKDGNYVTKETIFGPAPKPTTKLQESSISTKPHTHEEVLT